MLRVITSTEVNDCTLQVEDLPISFHCAEVASRTPFYWRTGDFKKSLLEIGLNQNTGAICKVTVTLIGSHYKMEVEDSTTTIAHDSLPICDVSEWPKDKFKDEPFGFSTLIGEDSVSIWIAPEAPLKMTYEIGRVGFAADREGYLRLLRFKDLSRFELDRVMKTVG